MYSQRFLSLYSVLSQPEIAATPHCTGRPAGAFQLLPKAVPALAALCHHGAPATHPPCAVPCEPRACPCPQVAPRSLEHSKDQVSGPQGCSSRVGGEGCLPLLERRAAEEEEAGRKEGLVCPFPERCRNCYMRNYLTSNLQMLFTDFLTGASPSSCSPAPGSAAAAASPELPQHWQLVSSRL